MPIANMLVDSTTNNELLSFMDGFFGYNQILIDGNEWLVMPFGLNNASVTY